MEIVEQRFLVVCYKEVGPLLLIVGGKMMSTYAKQLFVIVHDNPIFSAPFLNPEVCSDVRQSTLLKIIPSVPVAYLQVPSVGFMVRRMEERGKAQLARIGDTLGLSEPNRLIMAGEQDTIISRLAKRLCPESIFLVKEDGIETYGTGKDTGLFTQACSRGDEILQTVADSVAQLTGSGDGDVAFRYVGTEANYPSFR